MSEEVKDIRIDSDHGLEPNDALTKSIQELKKQLEAKDQEAAKLRTYAEQAARIAQDRDAAARQAEAKLQQANAYSTHNEYAAVASKLEEQETRAAALQSQLAAAIETADGKSAAKLNAEIAAIEARKLVLQQGKERIEEEIQQAQRAAQIAAQRPKTPPQQQRQQPIGDPFESAIAPLPEAQKAWLRQHKDKGYIRPDNPQELVSPTLLKAFYAAREAGLDQTNPKFMEHMDRTLGHGGEPEHGEASERFVEEQPKPPQRAQPAQQERRAVPAAPVSRDTGGGGGSRSANIRLTPAQTEAAARLQMTPLEYVEMTREAIKQNKWPASVPLPTWA